MMPLKRKPLAVMQVLPMLNMGGVERGTVEFSIYLKQQGHHPIVVSNGGSMVPELLKHGVQHINLNVGKKSLLTLFSIRQLRKCIRENNVDIVHARSRLPAWLCFFALKRLKPRPHFVTTLHGLHSVTKYSSIMARGDDVIAVSQTAKDYLLKNFSLYLKHQPTVIYRGIDAQFVNNHKTSVDWLKSFYDIHPALKQGKKILLPGRFSAVKGFEYIIPWLQNSENGSYLLVTAKPNDSTYSERMYQKLNALGLAEKVIWLGVVNDMPSLYASVDLVISINKKPESFGRTVLEALSMRVPVVAFDIGGVSEVMNQLFPEGLVPYEDTEALADRLKQFLAKPPVVKPHNQFSNKTMFDKIIGVYNKLMHSEDE